MNNDPRDQGVYLNENGVLSFWDGTGDIGITPAGLSGESVAFSDTFERANTTGTLGTPSGGGAWQPLTGAAAATAGITSGRYVSPNGVCYAGYVAPSQPLRIGGKFSITGAGSTFALISSADASILLNKMIHCICDETSFAVTWWSGASQSQLFASVSSTQTTFATPLLTDGTVYEIWMTIRGNTVHVDLPDGSTWDGYDPNVSTLSGALTIWEITGANKRWESVAIDSTITQTVRGTATFTGGLQGTPIGNVTPSSGRFTQAAVGAPASTISPQAAMHVFGLGSGTKPDAAWFESPAGHSVVRVKAPTSGFSKWVVFDSSAAGSTSDNQKIGTSGNNSDIEIWTNGTARLTIANTGVSTFSSRVVTVLSATSAAGFNVPHGAAPTSPVNGDVWTTTAGLFVQINGVTKTVTLT